MSDLTAVQEAWEQAAQGDALWNILTLPEKDQGRWTYEDFYLHGALEIDHALRHLGALSLDTHRSRALDFGCGAGRLTVALARHYKSVDGVDLSATMIELAKAHKPDGLRIRYHHNVEPNLRLFSTSAFDLVYSNIVLQHMPQELQRGYLAEIIRIVRPRGAALIEIPAGPDMPHPLHRWLDMYAVSEADVVTWVREAGGHVAYVELLSNMSAWQCNRYTIVKAGR